MSLDNMYDKTKYATFYDDETIENEDFDEDYYEDLRAERIMED